MNKIKLSGLTAKEEFREASKEELRVLVALIENGELNTEKLAEVCKISKSRASSALHFWQSADVLYDDGEQTITEEFEERLRAGEIDEESAVKVASNIRDNSLAELIEECTILVNKSALTTQEIKNISALTTQYGLSAEYIATLACFLKGTKKTKFTIRSLCDYAIKLTNLEINDESKLNAYIIEKEAESSLEWEIRIALGIYGRALADEERKFFLKWNKDFCFGIEIIKLAYETALVATGRLSTHYMDKLLTDWNKAGCKTLAECKKRKEEKDAENKSKFSTGSKAEKERPRYGDFDVNDAFQKALKRSFETIEDLNSDK